MTITDLNNDLTELLKYYIKKNEHIDTGRLYKGVKYACTYNEKTEEMKIRLVSEDYIVYLDEGTFLDSFYTLFKVQNAFANFYEYRMVQNFKLKF